MDHNDVLAAARPIIGDVAADLFDNAPSDVRSLALVVMHRGDVVFERYGTQPDTLFGPGGPVTADTTLISWSMAKSITHAAVGALVADGVLQLHAPAPVAAWQGTAKEAITLDHLLAMRSGLQFVEDYVDGEASADMAAYAASLPLLHEPGAVYNYSSGTTNIVSRIVANAVGGGREGMEAFLRDRVFGPAGMTSAIPKFDDAGTFVGSSYVYATACDFARFGDWYRTSLAAGGSATLTSAWVEHAREFTANDDPFDYGHHWWLWPDLPGSFGCHGYEGQYTLVVPDRELVLVHLGKWPDGTCEPLWAAMRRLIDAIPVRPSAINRG